MLTLPPWGTALYLVGAAWALLRSDASRGERVVLAVLWPVGPAAFVVTIAVLVLAAGIAFPLIGALMAAAVWWAVN